MERIDAFERRVQGLDGEARSRLNALERRVQELEAAQAQGELDRRSPSPDTTLKTLAADAPSRVRIVLPSPDRVHDARLDDEPRIAPSAQPALDKRTAHASYMRAWRLRRALRRGEVHA